MANQGSVVEKSQFRHRSQHQFSCLTGIGLLALSVLAVTCVQSLRLEAEESIRERVLRLLTAIHSPDEGIRTTAHRELTELGIREDRLRHARLLKHPDRIARLKLVQRLPEISEPLLTDLRSELLRDTDRHVRMAVLKILTPETISGPLLEQLGELQKTESDPVVRLQIQQLLNPESSETRLLEPIQPKASTLPPEAPTQKILSSQLPRDQSSRQQNPLTTSSHSSVETVKLNSPAVVKTDPATASPANQSATARVEKTLLPLPESAVEQVASDTVLPEPEIPLPDPDQNAGSAGSTVSPSVVADTLTSDQPDVLEQELTVEELFEIETLPRLQPFSGTRRPPIRNPEILDRPLDSTLNQKPSTGVIEQVGGWVTPVPEAPYGFTGPSGILPSESQEDAHFVPQPDRWRIGYEKWDRYGTDHPWVDDYPGIEGHWWDPYNQNVLKGDFPIIGQHTFFNLTAT
ncbi:MAG: hypothetical protein VB858_10015, partial [Planctomycetaceae bacterium]